MAVQLASFAERRQGAEHQTAIARRQFCSGGTCGDTAEVGFGDRAMQ